MATIKVQRHYSIDLDTTEIEKEILPIDLIASQIDVGNEVGTVYYIKYPLSEEMMWVSSDDLDDECTIVTQLSYSGEEVDLIVVE